MANYPGSLDSLPTGVAGTTLLADGTNPHAQSHDNANSAINAIESTMGTTQASALFGAFTSADKPARQQNGTFSQAMNGTFNNSTFGTSTITGGTINNAVIGTPAVTGGTLTNPNINNGTFTGGGALLSKVISTTRDMTAAAGTVAYTGLGFKPSAVIAIAIINSSQSFNIAVCGSDVSQNVGINQYAANTLIISSYIVNIETSAGVNQYASLLSYDPDGFTLTWGKTSTPTGTANIIFLCFR